jgi:SAM-dependent methyltransferase
MTGNRNRPPSLVMSLTERVVPATRAVRATTEAALWAGYSWCYDGVLDLAPYRELVSITCEAVGATPGMRVLDAGCGTGNVTAGLLDLCADMDILAVDGSARMVAQTRAKFAGDERVTIEEGFLPGVLGGEPDSSFDTAVTQNVVYTLTPRCDTGSS